MVELKKWYIDKDEDAWKAHGEAYGHDRFEDGMFLSTSEIVSITVAGRELVLATRNSRYYCDFSEANLRDESFFEDENLFVDEYYKSEVHRMQLAKQLQKVMEQEKNGEDGKEEVIPSSPAEVERCLVFVFSEKEEDGFKHGYMKCEPIEDKYFKKDKRVGRKKDYITLILHCRQALDLEEAQLAGFDVVSEGDLEYRYTLEKGRVAFYRWSEYNGPIFVENAGTEGIEIDTPVGYFYIPAGATSRIATDNRLGRLTEHKVV